MAFNVEAARADGVSEEDIQAILASEQLTKEITTEEVVVTPEPPQPQPQPQAQPQPTTGFDVERARADKVSEEDIQAILASEQQPPQENQQPTTGFDVERARADGVSEEDIQAILASEQQPPQENQQPTDGTERAGFIDSVVGSLSDLKDIAGVGLSTLLPGGESTDEAAARYIKEQESEPQRTRFSYAAIEDAFSKGGMKGVKELIAQLPGGFGEAIGAIGPSLAVGAAAGLVGGPIFALLAIAATSVGPIVGGNVIEQATADIEAGRPLDVDTATALVTAAPQVALDLIPFKFSALKKLIGFEKKLPPGALQKKIAEQGLGKAIGKDAVSIVGQEIPAEIGQEILTKIQAGKDAFSEEAIQEYKEVAAIVFFSGGLGAYTGPKSRSKARQQIKLAEDKLNNIDSSEENVELKANDIIKGWQGQNTKKQQRKANQDIKNRSRASLNILDVDTLAVMGIDEQNTPILYKALLNKSTTNKQGREEIREIFEANSGNYANVNATAVNSFLKRIAKLNDPKAKRFNNRRVGASPDVSEQQSDPNQTDTTSIETDERISMDDSTGSTGRISDGTSQLNNTLIKKNPFNKKLKPKQKRTIAEVINNQVVIRKGEVIKQEDGTLALKEDVSGEIITFNQNQVINPTKKDQGVLSTIAEETKSKEQKAEESAEDFIRGPQFAKDETPSDKQELERLRFAVAEGEYQAGSFMKASEPVPKRLADRIENDKKKLQEKEQEIAQRPPEQQELFAKEGKKTYTFEGKPIPQKLIDQHRKMQENDEASDGTAMSYGKGSQRSSTIINRNFIKQQQAFLGQGDSSLTPRGREFDRLLDEIYKENNIQEARTETAESIPNTGETTESITKSFKNQYGNNIDLAVKRGLINIVPNVNSLPSEIDIESIPDNAKAFFYARLKQGVFYCRPY